MKPFSKDGEGHAIRTYTIARDLMIENAPVKGQCARDYLHGRGVEIEKALQAFEGAYARITRLLLSGATPLDLDLHDLRSFAFLQYLRTEMHIKRLKTDQEGLLDDMFSAHPEQRPKDLSDQELMVMSLSLFAEMRKNIVDLKPCIIRNETRLDFVTSDDPAIIINKFHVQRLKRSSHAFGSAGAILVLPLSPRLLLCCYDGDVYNLIGREGAFLRITKVADAEMFNELQNLKAERNIYFSQWDTRDQVRAACLAARPRRPTSWSVRKMYLPAEAGAGNERTWREVTLDEYKAIGGSALISGSPIHPTPSAWFSALRYRDKPKYFFNGSGAGYLRLLTRSLDEADRFIADVARGKRAERHRVVR
jgi:hypothetical protein